MLNIRYKVIQMNSLTNGGAAWSVTVYKLGSDASNDWGTTVADLQYSKIRNRINFALDSDRKSYNNKYKPTEKMTISAIWIFKFYRINK